MASAGQGLTMDYSEDGQVQNLDAHTSRTNELAFS